MQSQWLPHEKELFRMSLLLWIWSGTSCSGARKSGGGGAATSPSLFLSPL